MSDAAAESFQKIKKDTAASFRWQPKRGKLQVGRVRD